MVPVGQRGQETPPREEVEDDDVEVDGHPSPGTPALLPVKGLLVLQGQVPWARFRRAQTIRNSQTLYQRGAKVNQAKYCTRYTNKATRT